MLGVAGAWLIWLELAPSQYDRRIAAMARDVALGTWVRNVKLTDDVQAWRALAVEDEGVLAARPQRPTAQGPWSWADLESAVVQQVRTGVLRHPGVVLRLRSGTQFEPHDPEAHRTRRPRETRGGVRRRDRPAPAAHRWARHQLTVRLVPYRRNSMTKNHRAGSLTARLPLGVAALLLLAACASGSTKEAASESTPTANASASASPGSEPLAGSGQRTRQVNSAQAPTGTWYYDVTGSATYDGEDVLDDEDVSFTVSPTQKDRQESVFTIGGLKITTTQKFQGNVAYFVGLEDHLAGHRRRLPEHPPHWACPRASRPSSARPTRARP